MADENVTVGINADATSFDEAMAHTVEANRGYLDQLTQDQAAATAAMRSAQAELTSLARNPTFQQAINSNTESVKQAAQAIQGELSNSLKSAQVDYTNISSSIVAVQDALFAQTRALYTTTQAADQAAAAINHLSVAEVEESAAAELASVSGQKVNTSLYQNYMQARLLGAEVGVSGPIAYGLSRYAASSTAISSVIGSVFPVVLAIGFAEAIGQVGKEILNLYRAWDVAYQSQQRYFEEAKKNTAEYHKLLDESEKQRFERVSRESGKPEGFQEQVLSKKLDLEGDIRTYQRLTDEIKKQQAIIEQGTHQTEGPGVHSSLGTPIYETFGTTTTETEPDRKARAANFEKLRLEDELGIARLKISDDQNKYDKLKAELDKAQEDQDKKDAAEAKREYAERLSAVRTADSEAMSALEQRAAAELTIGHALTIEKIALVQQELVAEVGFHERVKELDRELATLRLQSVREYIEGQKLAQRAVEQGVTESAAQKRKESEEYSVRIVEDRINALKREQKERQELQVVLEDSIKLGGEGNVDKLELEKASATGQSQIHPNIPTNPLNQGVSELAETQKFDSQIIAEKLDTARRLAEIDKINSANDPKKYQADLQTIAKLQQQHDLQAIQQSTQMTLLLQKNWMSYFNTVNQGLVQSLNAWIEGHQSITRILQNMLVKLLEQWADYWAKKILLDAENWIISKVLAATSSQAQAQSSIGASAAAAGAGAAASQAAIPIVGPELAIAAGASVYTQVQSTYLALAAAGAAYETGGIAANTGLALHHAGEATLPKQLTGFLMNAAGQGGRGGGATTINAPTTINGLHSKDVIGALSKNSSKMKGVIRKAIRSANIR